MAREVVKWGLLDERPVRIDEVPNGLACGCVCPVCKDKLVAKNGGRVREHCFAHYGLMGRDSTGAEDCSPCEHVNETALHLRAKAIIEDAEWLWIPPVKADVTPDEQLFFQEAGLNVNLTGWQEFKIVSATSEYRLEDVVVDSFVETEEAPLFVEIYVSHKVDRLKYEKLREYGISTMEIDLSNVDHEISDARLREIVLGKSEQKQWVWSKLAESRAYAMRKEAYEIQSHKRESDLKAREAKVESTKKVSECVQEESAEADFCAKDEWEEKTVAASRKPRRNAEEQTIERQAVDETLEKERREASNIKRVLDSRADARKAMGDAVEGEMLPIGNNMVVCPRSGKRVRAKECRYGSGERSCRYYRHYMGDMVECAYRGCKAAGCNGVEDFIPSDQGSLW